MGRSRNIEFDCGVLKDGVRGGWRGAGKWRRAVSRDLEADRVGEKGGWGVKDPC